MIPHARGLFLEDTTGARHFIDIAFPVLHGPGGEDGSIQGLLETLGTPYIGSGVAASAIAMDKVLTKQLLSYSGIPVAPWVTIHQAPQIPPYEEVSASLDSSILFIKPSGLGSSVGVSRISCSQEYEAKVKEAFLYSHTVIVEKALQGAEVECAILGHRTLQASQIGEIVINQGDFYSYEAKYLSDAHATILSKARLIPSQIHQLQELSLKAFRAIGCSGMARVDSFVTKEGIFVNEINTIPGFTPISLYPKLWAESGVPPHDLLKKLIECAYERFSEDRQLHLTPKELTL
jgi:D-alanine-D-alanine ligase